MLPIAKGVPSPLSLHTFAGAPGGMSRNQPQHELQDIEAWTIADAVLQDPGYIRRRGPLAELAGTSKANRRTLGIARVQDPSGTEQVAILALNSQSSVGELYGAISNTSSLAVAWPYTPSVAPMELVDTAPALNGGVLIGSAASYDGTPANQAVRFWKGASTNDTASITLSSTVNRGDTTVSVSTAAGLSAGMWLFAHTGGYLIGSIKSISGTTLTLEHPALVTVASGAAAMDATALRGLTKRIATGFITTTAGATTVNGGGTKFKALGLASGTSIWDFYTPDYTYIGTISASGQVASNTQFTLDANAPVSYTNQAYIAIQRDAVYTGSTAPFGWLSEQFGGHQFYAKGNRLYFSSNLDPEAVDTTEDGDWLTFSADPIRAIMATTTELLVMTETETYSLMGAVGTTPDRWRGQRIIDDGTVCGMTAAAYKGGVMWAGNRGIHFYDGAQPVNMAASLSNDYRKFVLGFSSASSRAYAAIVNDHALFFFEGGASGIFQRVKAGVATDISRPTFLIGLGSGAISILQNVEVRGYVPVPDKLNLSCTAVAPITTLLTGTYTGRSLNLDALFTGTGNDSWACAGGAAGPDFFVETKLYNMGDAQRLKLHRMLLMHHSATGGNVAFDHISGLAKASTTPTDQFRANTDWTDQRIKFNRKSQHIGFRFYQSTISGDPSGSHSAANITYINLASWAVAFKWKRPGRT